MPLSTVTITGADDTTDISEMLQLSGEFPFLEWGVLIKNRDCIDAPRFPSHDWQQELWNGMLACVTNLQLSMHLCGQGVSDLLTGDLDWELIHPGLLDAAGRMQINTHANTYEITDAFFAQMTLRSRYTPAWNRCGRSLGRNFIFQLDGVNDFLLNAAHDLNMFQAAGLHDLSHGQGHTPSAWPGSSGNRGYAGGLGPDNLIAQLPLIEAAAHGHSYWIDMESNARTDDGLRLDMDKVRCVLELCDRFRKLKGHENHH